MCIYSTGRGFFSNQNPPLNISMLVYAQCVFCLALVLGVNQGMSNPIKQTSWKMYLIIPGTKGSAQKLTLSRDSMSNPNNKKLNTMKFRGLPSKVKTYKSSQNYQNQIGNLDFH